MAKTKEISMTWQKNKETKNPVVVFKKNNDQPYCLELEKEHQLKQPAMYVVFETNVIGMPTGNAVVIRSNFSKAFLDYFFYAANCYGVEQLADTVAFLKKKDATLQASRAEATSWKNQKEKTPN